MLRLRIRTRVCPWDTQSHDKKKLYVILYYFSSIQVQLQLIYFEVSTTIKLTSIPQKNIVENSVLVSFSTEVIIKNFTKSSKITGETVQWLIEVSQIFICLFYLIRSREEGNGNPLQYSCLENSMDRGAWQTVVHGDVKSWT